MWAALFEFLKGLWNGPKEKIEPVIEGFSGAIKEWRMLYAEVKDTLTEVKTELEECREDRKQLNRRIDALETKTS